MLSDQEIACAQVAVSALDACGGRATFDEYDREIGSQISPGRPKYPIWAPVNWCFGWGDPALLRRNNEKLAVFAAVKAGFVRLIDRGYELV